MTLPVWGQLQKSLDDSETIEEAIIRLINEHAADPTAHLGSGESLNAHKTDEVIDHPAQSIVADKLPFAQYEMSLFNNSDLGWENWIGNWSYNSSSGWVIENLTQTEFDGSGFPPWLDYEDYPDADLVFQFRLSMRYANSSSDIMAFGTSDDTAVSGKRMVWELDDGAWFWRLYDGGTLLHSYEFASGANFTKYFRIHFDPVREALVLYVGTVEASFYDESDWRDFIWPQFVVYMDVDSSPYASMGFAQFKSLFSEDINL